ncbi:MAG: glycosyltransferase family 2 protein [Chloroflexota bacterium]|nr:glycosyltransferase family 2 protein [Dehalococcoidia bacterium]MDW8253363.1 glycosyltransferase family 2 protein [Chloroflexota bacterium]
MRLSVLMPVYNEELTLEKALRRLAALPLELEIIVVDDCSTDATWEILQAIELPGLVRLRHPVNRGKGAAVRTALAAATGDWVIIQDADLEYDPGDFPKLLRPALAGDATVVYGARNLASQKPLLRFGNQFLTWLTNLLYGSRLSDMETCYKLMPRTLALELNLECERFDLEPEITAKVLRRGLRIVEVPISYVPRADKKLSPWRDGLPAVVALLKYRFSRARSDR